jgi:hypothetical protein
VMGHDIYHVEVGAGGGIGCRRCQQHGRLKAAWPWVLAQCPGPGAVNGHNVSSTHGLQVCGRCGRYSTMQTHSNGLRSKCQGYARAQGKRLFRRLAQEPPLPPYGFTRWPDGTAVPPGVLKGPGKKRRRSEVGVETGVGRAVGGSSVERARTSQPKPVSRASLPPCPAFCSKDSASASRCVPVVAGAQLQLAALRARVRAREAESAEGVVPMHDFRGQVTANSTGTPDT